MGTRHLTFAKIDGEYKIAQYGQWDGYPEGQGVTVLEFARKLKDPNTAMHFICNLRRCRWIDKHEADKLNALIDSGKINLLKDYPQFHRDTGAEILDFVLSAKSNEIVLKNSFSFAFDHLFCEYIWGINMDRFEFGLYYGSESANDIVPINTWPIDKAPSKEEFLKEFEAND